MVVYNAHKMMEEQYYVILVGMYEDSPAAAKTTRTGSATAIYPCHRCVMEAQLVEGCNKSTYYPVGYKEKVTLSVYPLLDEHVPWRRGIDPAKSKRERKVLMGE